MHKIVKWLAQGHAGGQSVAEGTQEITTGHTPAPQPLLSSSCSISGASSYTGAISRAEGVCTWPWCVLELQPWSFTPRADPTPRKALSGYLSCIKNQR